MKNTITKILIVVTLVMMAVGLNSCYTERTAQRQVDKAHHKFPLVPAKFCADTYPPTDSTHVIKEYLQGEDVVYVDTVDRVEQYFDTVKITKYITKTVKQTDTIRDVKYVQQTDKAGMAVCAGELKKTREELIIMTDSRGDYRNYTIILGCIILLYGAYRFIKWKILNK